MNTSEHPTTLQHRVAVLLDLKSEVDLGAQEFSAITEVVRQHSGMVVHGGSIQTLRRAIMHRMTKLQIQSPEEYLKILSSSDGQEERNHLVSLVVVQKTSFFRDPMQFRLLVKELLPALTAHSSQPASRVRIWSAGCATGEEPYSLAMLLFQHGFRSPNASVLATDISNIALEEARQGIFRNAKMADLPSELVDDKDRFFLSEEKGWRIRPEIGALVEFRFQNLAGASYPVPPDGLWDIIFCRNVLIYFERETVCDIVNRFREVLAPGGYLFLGSSESLFQLVDGFELRKAEQAFVYQRSDKAPPKAVPISVVKPAGPERQRRPEPLRQPVTKKAQPSSLKPGVSFQETLAAAELRDAKQKLEKGETDQAWHILVELTRKTPSSVEPYALLGQMALNRGALEEARSWFLVAIELQPLDEEIRFLMAVVLYRLGADQEAADELRRLLFLDGNFALGHYYLGMIAERLEDLELAERSFRNALQAIEKSDQGRLKELLEAHHLSSEALSSASRARMQTIQRRRNHLGV